MTGTSPPSANGTMPILDGRPRRHRERYDVSHNPWGELLWKALSVGFDERATIIANPL